LTILTVTIGNFFGWRGHLGGLAFAMPAMAIIRLVPVAYAWINDGEPPPPKAPTDPWPPGRRYQAQAVMEARVEGNSRQNRGDSNTKTTERSNFHRRQGVHLRA